MHVQSRWKILKDILNILKQILYRYDNINDIFLFTVTIWLNILFFAPSFNQDVLLVSVSGRAPTTASRSLPGDGGPQDSRLPVVGARPALELHNIITVIVFVDIVKVLRVSLHLV